MHNYREQVFVWNIITSVSYRIAFLRIRTWLLLFTPTAPDMVRREAMSFDQLRKCNCKFIMLSPLERNIFVCLSRKEYFYF